MKYMEIRYHQRLLLISSFDKSKFKIWKSDGLMCLKKKNQKNVFLVCMAVCKIRSLFNRIIIIKYFNKINDLISWLIKEWLC